MSRKGENIYKRKDGRWEGRYIISRSPEGKARYKSVYGKSYRSVKQRLYEQRILSEESNSASQMPGNAKILSDVLSEWLDTVQPNLKESSYIRYSNQIELHIRPFIGSLTLSSITTPAIQEYISLLLTSESVSGHRLSAKSISGILSILKRVFRYAGTLYAKVDCDIDQIMIRQNRPQMTVLTRQEQQKLCLFLSGQPVPVRAGVLLALYTGLRLGEVCALKWSDINLSTRLLYISRSMQRLQNRKGKPGPKTRILISAPKSSCSVRAIPLPDFIVSYLEQFRKDEGAYLLTGTPDKFMEPRSLQNHFKRILCGSGIRDVNFHSLRHTFATRCIESGFDIKSLSEILGHASVNITLNRYVHPSLELKKENMEKLSSLFTVN